MLSPLKKLSLMILEPLRVTELRSHPMLFLNHHLPLCEQTSPLTRCELSRIGHSHMCICPICIKPSFLFFPRWKGLTMRMSNMAHRVTFWSRQRPGPERHWHF